MARHLPSVVWLARRAGEIPNAEIATAGKGHITVAIYPADSDGTSFRVDRGLARLIARRIVQCLEETK